MHAKGRVLVVDDESDTVDLIRLTLETAGFEVEQALDGATALDMIESNPYDAILLDIMMPDLSGFDVMHKLHAAGDSFPPVIFLTARLDASDRETGEDLGAAGYLTKPTRRGELLDAITQAIGD